MKSLNRCLGLVAVLVLCVPSAWSLDLAKVNGKAITEKDMHAMLSNVNEGMRANILKDKKTRKNIVSSMVDQELLLQQAEKDKLDQEQEFKDALTLFRRNFLVNKLLGKHLKNKLTESAVKKYFESHKAFFSTDRVHAMHILVKDEAQAKDLIKKAKEPKADFQALAEKHSQDPSAKDNRGDLGFFGRGVMVPEFTEAAFAGNDGEVLPNPIKTAFGYHVIKVIEHRAGQLLSFSDAEESARGQLRQELTQEYVAELRDKAKIEIDEKAIDKM
jgi:peptidyl-prolyl cis-trans isomerase C